MKKSDELRGIENELFESAQQTFDCERILAMADMGVTLVFGRIRGVKYENFDFGLNIHEINRVVRYKAVPDRSYGIREIGTRVFGGQQAWIVVGVLSSKLIAFDPKIGMWAFREITKVFKDFIEDVTIVAMIEYNPGDIFMPDVINDREMIEDIPYDRSMKKKPKYQVDQLEFAEKVVIGQMEREIILKELKNAKLKELEIEASAAEFDDRSDAEREEAAFIEWPALAKHRDSPKLESAEEWFILGDGGQAAAANVFLQATQFMKKPRGRWTEVHSMLNSWNDVKATLELNLSVVEKDVLRRIVQLDKVKLSMLKGGLFGGMHIVDKAIIVAKLVYRDYVDVYANWKQPDNVEEFIFVARKLGKDFVEKNRANS